MDKINAEVFLTVAQTGSFRKAADRLGYTQAGISYIVSAMEESTGCTLFIREHGGVRLSPEGEYLIPHMQQLSAWERRFTESVNELHGLARGTLRVQIFDSVSVHWIPNILHEFCTDYPGIQVELVSEENMVRAREMLLNGEVDCGFFLSWPMEGIDTIALSEENLIVVLPPDHPMADAPCFPVKKLGDYPYISMKYEDRTPVGQVFTEEGITPHTVFTMDNDYAAMSMVSKGLGFCVLPELLVQNVPYNIRCMTFDVPKKRIISIGTRNLKTASRACRKFIEYTCRMYASYQQGAGSDPSS